MPYNPGVQPRSDLIVSNSLELGQRNTAMLGQWLSNFLDQQKQITAAGKAADAFTQADPEALTAMGIHPDQWKNLGARDRAAAVNGYVRAKTLSEEAARNQAAIDESKLRRQMFDQDMISSKRFQDAIAQFYNDGDPNQPHTNPDGATLTPDVLLRIGATSGMDPTKLAPLASALERIRANPGAGAPEIMTTPSGDTIYFNGKTGAFQLSPASKEAAKTDDGMIEIPDPENPVFGARIRIPLSVAKRDYPHLLKGLDAGARDGSAPANAPSDIKQRKAGTTYMTPKGALTWTGTGWIKP